LDLWLDGDMQAYYLLTYDESYHRLLVPDEFLLFVGLSVLL
jgi:hypothetical protein